MVLEAVWFKNGKEVFCISPIMNIVCDEDMDSIFDIEVEVDNTWYSCEENKFDADDFIIRIKKD